jgi:hypothetical protein
MLQASGNWSLKSAEVELLKPGTRWNRSLSLRQINVQGQLELILSKWVIEISTIVFWFRSLTIVGLRQKKKGAIQ